MAASNNLLLATIHFALYGRQIYNVNMNWDVLASIVGVVGGLLGFMTAAWVRWLGPLLRRPRLRLSPYTSARGGCAASKSSSTWVRLRVSNKRRSRYAQSAWVEVAWIDADKAALQNRKGPNNLDLCVDRLLRWADYPGLQRSIAPGMSYNIDLIRCHAENNDPYIEKSKGHPHLSAAEWRIAFRDVPRDGRDHLAPGNYVIWLTLACEKDPPRFQKVTLRLPESFKPGDVLSEDAIEVEKKSHNKLPRDIAESR